MPSQQQALETLERFLEQVLEPRIRSLLDSGEIATQADFDEALLPAAALQGAIDEWAADLKAALDYETLPATAAQDTTAGFASAAEREAWVAEVCEQLDVTRDQLADMDAEAVLRRIRGR